MLETRLLSQVAKRMPFAARASLDSHLFEELGFDSLLLLDLIYDLEKEFEIEFSENELSLDALKTPGNILRIIQSHKDKRETL